MGEIAVAPLVGAWIETRAVCRVIGFPVVAPLVGAWIETVLPRPGYMYSLSLPSWERGLKHMINVEWEKKEEVAPLVGAWIETYPDGMEAV